jgi:hypothetical protein
MPLYNPPGGGSHPDLATHDTLGLATDAELTTHAGAADPHTGYVLESDHTSAAHDTLGLTTDALLSTAISDHAGAADPHTGYLKESDFDDVDFLVGTATGLTAAEIVVGTTPGGELGGTWASPTVDATHSGSAHHTQAHVITGADHTASGLTIGHVLTASSASAFGFAAPAAPVLTSASAFATAETTVSAATYADITGCSVSLAAGTWIVYGNVIARAVNAIIQVFVAITHNDNTVISESATSRPASGTANLNSPIAVSWFAIVSPGSTTTYKLRGARGVTTHTGSWIAMDGNGVNTANHATNNTDKGTGIFAIKIG